MFDQIAIMLELEFGKLQFHLELEFGKSKFQKTYYITK